MSAMELEDLEEQNEVNSSDMEDYSVEEDAHSICNDLDALLQNAVNTEAVLHVMEEQVKALQKMIDTPEFIFFEYNGVRVELKEIIDILHTESVKSIQEGREMTFGYELLKILESYNT